MRGFYYIQMVDIIIAIIITLKDQAISYQKYLYFSLHDCWNKNIFNFWFLLYNYIQYCFNGICEIQEF